VRYRKWWLDQYSLEELVKLGRGSRPDPAGSSLLRVLARTSRFLVVSVLLGFLLDEPAAQIHRLDIVVFRTPGRAAVKCGEGGTFVKRVIGLSGETVREEDHGFIWIRAPGSRRWDKLEEQYLTAPRRIAGQRPFRAELARP
jgi:hypothetical protein